MPAVKRSTMDNARRMPCAKGKQQQTTATSGRSSTPSLPNSLLQLQEQLNVPDDDAPLSNGVFRRAFSQVFSALFEHCTGLANNITELMEENKRLKADMQTQHVEIQQLRNQVTLLTSSVQSAGLVNISSNVLVHGIQESANETLLDMKRNALQHLSSVDTSIVVNSADILTVNRLGLPKQQSSSQQRPLVVRLTSSKLCRQLAKASYTRYISDKEGVRGKPYITLHLHSRALYRNNTGNGKVTISTEPTRGERRHNASQWR